MTDYIDEQKKAWEETGAKKDELPASPVVRRVMCVCRICGNGFDTIEDEDGEPENDICRQCESDNIDQQCWERDNFD
jgi:hypothetical protein